MARTVVVERESEVRFLFHFSEASREFRERMIGWLKRRFDDIILLVDWRQIQDTLIVVVKRAEAAFAFTALNQEIQRRALFK